MWVNLLIFCLKSLRGVVSYVLKNVIGINNQPHPPVTVLLFLNDYRKYFDNSCKICFDFNISISSATFDQYNKNVSLAIILWTKN